MSPYVAAYFAVVDLWKKPGAVWLFREKRLNTAAIEVISKMGKLELQSEEFWFSENSLEGILPMRQWNYPTVRVVSALSQKTQNLRRLGKAS